jgi:hypothetical protein
LHRDATRVDLGIGPAEVSLLVTAEAAEDNQNARDAGDELVHAISPRVWTV